ncbi:double zinc ribbon domain-containing protein [Pantoea sp. CTOTU49201]|uniref:double zinc ribbon domain-containing protein n=1 Tax=Pantoea sp. CTOTU49201 TaxID=2953855 RepID=UPI0039183CE4
MGLFKSLFAGIANGRHGHSRHHGGHGHHNEQYSDSSRYAPSANESLKIPCPHCQYLCNKDDRFCGLCGGATNAICPNCSKVISPVATFCNSCGSQQQKR